MTEYHVPGGGTTTYAYDSRNRLISEKTPKLSDLGATRVMTYDDCDRPTAEKYRRDSDGRVVQTHSWTYYPFGSSAPAGSRGLLQSETVWEIPQSVAVNQSSLAYCTRNYSYDSEGRVTGIAESWSDGWTSNVSTTYDFVGNVTSVIESHSGPGGYSQTISTSYTYDQRGRKLTSSRSVSGTDTGNMTLATVTYSYDELGRPSGKTVTGSNGSTLIYEDFDLDIHGWTTSISAKDNGNVPFFFENLSYTNPSRSISTARFDGNISEITSVHNTEGANNALAIYSYSYDGMKRLTDARHTGISTLLTESDKNTERYISYDRNGNITGLTRYDSDGNADAITFSHTGNRMTSVNGNSYSYDSAGNMTRDGRKGLDISYNCLNLPSHAETADGSSLTYTYLADGTKVSAKNGGNGLRYIGSFTYSDSVSNNSLESIACDEGRYSLVGDDSSSTTLKDLFFVTDHLGNVRSIADVSPGLTAPVILEQNDYLPFGTKVQNSSYANVTENRYRYANKEEQSIGGINLSLLDFGARYYDPYIARWTSVDPMANSYLGINPYSYCIGNPIFYSDQNGKFISVIAYSDNNKVYTYELSKSCFVDSKGEVYNGKDTFILDLTKQLNILCSENNGLSLVTELSTSDKGVLIMPGKSNGESAYSFDVLIPNIESGIKYSLSSSVPGGTAYTSLAHELAHSKDRIDGTLDTSVWISKESYQGEKDILQAEKTATHIENLVRKEHGLPIRTQYLVDPARNSHYVSRVTDNNMRSLYFDINGAHRDNYRMIKSSLRYKY